jgi:hypothetical protein
LRSRARGGSRAERSRPHRARRAAAGQRSPRRPHGDRRAGAILLVEVKSCRADFVADRKWQEYLAYSDRFYFAVGRDFPLGFLPPEEGLILADRFGGEIVRPAPLRALSPARRKALLIRFGRAAASRLQALIDPRPLVTSSIGIRPL